MTEHDDARGPIPDGAAPSWADIVTKHGAPLTVDDVIAIASERVSTACARTVGDCAADPMRITITAADGTESQHVVKLTRVWLDGRGCVERFAGWFMMGGLPHEVDSGILPDEYRRPRAQYPECEP